MSTLNDTANANTMTQQDRFRVIDKIDGNSNIVYKYTAFYEFITTVLSSSEDSLTDDEFYMFIDFVKLSEGMPV